MNRKLVALALLAAIISGCVSCGDAADEDPGTTEENVSGNDMTDTTEAEEKFVESASIFLNEAVTVQRIEL